MRAYKRKHHIIYKTTCAVTGNWYVGMHSTDDLNDGYLGSGTRLWKSIKKHGKENHTYEILEHLPSRELLVKREEELVNHEMLLDSKCMNLRTGGTGNCGRATSEETGRKISESNRKYREQNGTKVYSEAGTKRWAKEKAARQIANDTPIVLSREEVLALLITESGQLNKNATRCISKAIKAIEMPSRTREANVVKRWRAVHQAIDNPIFPDLVEKINAYVNGIENRPTCKICSQPVTFFRFNKPYATYCGARCQLLDPSHKSPVLSRWQR